MRLNKKNLACAFILVSMMVGFVLYQPFALNQNSSAIDENYPIKTSAYGDPIHPTNIFLNDSRIISLFESVKIDLNTSEFNDANYTKIQFEFSDGSTLFEDMTYDVGSNFTYIYTPSYNVPTGYHKIYFQIYNETGELLNENTTCKQIFIDTHYYAATFVSQKLFLNETLDVSLTILNISTYEFTYQVSIVNSTESDDQETLKIIPGSNIEWFNLSIKQEDFDIVNKNYYIKVDLTDSGKTHATYFRFRVLNHNPEIISSTISIPDKIYRTRDFDISINISDIETNTQNINVSMQLSTPLGIKLNTVTEAGSSTNNFTLTMNIPKNRPVGQYLLNITAQDPDGGVSSYINYIQVLNIRPEIKNYEINGLPRTQQISVFYGDDLTFTFNVSDVDGTIKYITVSLINEEGEWFNITKLYNQNFEISIRSIDLVRGTWNVYISVTDSNDGTTTLTSDIGTAPQQIRIIPDALGLIMPWVTLIIGLIVGLLIGVAFAYKILQSRGRAKIEPEKKEAKKIPSKPREKKPSEAEKEAEEIEEKEKPTKKKIKRRL